jgi:uncharacterized membrane protein
MMNFTLPTESPTEEAPADYAGYALRWRYVIGPLIMLTLSIIAVAFFYPQLPAETAVRFSFAGTPKVWFSRTTTTALMLAPQCLLTLVAVGVTWGLTHLSPMLGLKNGTSRKLEYVMLFIGNAVVLPQFVLFFTMLDIFSYNAYQQHILPIWLLLVGLLGIVTIVLGIFITLAIRKYRRPETTQPEDKTKESP